MTKPICVRCKVQMIPTELKDVWKCPVCNVIENKRLSNEH
jgi:predicted RNA-binding Zn-ribbon protein involved in translation (DUF1610 family)